MPTTRTLSGEYKGTKASDLRESIKPHLIKTREFRHYNSFSSCSLSFTHTHTHNTASAAVLTQILSLLVSLFSTTRFPLYFHTSLFKFCCEFLYNTHQEKKRINTIEVVVVKYRISCFWTSKNKWEEGSGSYLLLLYCYCFWVYPRFSLFMLNS